MHTKVCSFLPYEKHAKERKAVHAIQHLLGHLATLFQHKAEINPAITGLILGQCWIIWPGLKTLLHVSFWILRDDNIFSKIAGVQLEESWGPRPLPFSEDEQKRAFVVPSLYQMGRVSLRWKRRNSESFLSLRPGHLSYLLR